MPRRRSSHAWSGHAVDAACGSWSRRRPRPPQPRSSCPAAIAVPRHTGAMRTTGSRRRSPRGNMPGPSSRRSTHTGPTCRARTMAAATARHRRPRPARTMRPNRRCRRSTSSTSSANAARAGDRAALATTSLPRVCSTCVCATVGPRSWSASSHRGSIRGRCSHTTRGSTSSAGSSASSFSTRSRRSRRRTSSNTSRSELRMNAKRSPATKARSEAMEGWEAPAGFARRREGTGRPFPLAW